MLMSNEPSTEAYFPRRANVLWVVGLYERRRLRPPTSSGPSVGGLFQEAPPALLLVVLFVGDLCCRVDAVRNGKPGR